MDASALNAAAMTERLIDAAIYYEQCDLPYRDSARKELSEARSAIEAALASAPAPASGGVDAVARRAKYLLNRLETDDGLGIGEIDTMLRMAASLSPAATPVSEAEPVAAVVAEELALKIVSLSVNWLREDGTDREHDDYVRANWTKEIAEAKRLILAALAKPAAGGDVADDLVSRAEVLRVIRALGDQDADLALYGAADNARAREYGEAAATRACCAIALMPAALSSSAGPAVEPVATIGFYENEREPRLLSWNKLPNGEHHLYAHPAPATVEISDAMIDAGCAAWVKLYPAFDGEKPQPTAGDVVKAILSAALAPATEGRKG